MASAPEPAPAPARPGVDGEITIDHARFCLAPLDAAAVPDCAWTTVPLAKVWHTRQRTGMGDAWYELRFELPAVPAHGLALYVPAFNRTGRLFVNGAYAQSFGSMADPLPLNWNRGQFAVLSPGLLHAGVNTLAIQQRICAWENGWLATVRLGDEAHLRRVWESRRFWQNELVRVLGATTAALGAFMLAVWVHRRGQAMYFWFACASFTWTAISLDYFAQYAPLPPLAWENFVECAQVLRAVLMFMFVLRYCDRRMPRFEAAFWAWFVLGTAGIWTHLVPGRLVDDWYLVVLLVSPYFFWLLVRHGLRHSRLEGVMLGLAASLQIVLSGYDLWLFSQHSWTDRIYLAHFSAPVYLVVVAWVLMRRFAESLGAYERLAAVLEQRVAAKAAELERNYEQLGEARRNEALALERSRIMSEMHDGIGSQLTLALSLVRSMDAQDGHAEDGRVATVLRESIEDLQLIIDSLEPVENDLLTVLGTLRYRLQDRLSRSGVELQWNVVDLPPLPMLTPHSVLSILRIVKEAFANCLKHAGAKRIAVATDLSGTPGSGEVARIRITDDGGGIAGTRTGRGLENMRRRAEALGGRLKITSRPGCTEVMLEIPTMRGA